MSDSRYCTTRKEEGLAAKIPWAWVKKVRNIVDNPPLGASLRPCPIEIQPWLFLSDQTSLRNRQPLIDAGITHVLSVNALPKSALDVLSDQFQTWKIVHKHVRGEDEEGYDMIGRHWDECLAFVQRARSEREDAKIVVHCSAGINRSGLIVAALYMTMTQTPVIEVVESLVARREMVLWNRSFQLQLCLLAAREGLLGPWPSNCTDEAPNDMPGPPPTMKSLLDRFTK